MKNVFYTIFIVACFLSPFSSHAKETPTKQFQTPSGAIVIVPHDKEWIEKSYTLPSGFIYKILVPVLIQTARADDTPIKDVIKEHIIRMAKKYDTDTSDLLFVANCESRFDPEAKGDYSTSTQKYMANGVFQFWKGTFDQFSKDSGIPNLQYKNWQDQSRLAAWAFSNDLQYHWKICWNRAQQRNK